MYCSNCDKVVDHMLIRKHSLVDAKETAYLFRCNKCNLLIWIVSEYYIE